MNELPYAPESLERCTDHPDALVRHTYDADFYILNGERAGTGINKRTVSYECAECRRPLSIRAVLQSEGK